MWVICERRIGGNVAEICSVVYCRYFLRICVDGLCNTIKISATCKSGLRTKIRNRNSRALIRATNHSTPTSGLSAAEKYLDGCYIQLFCMTLVTRFSFCLRRFVCRCVKEETDRHLLP
jgi:hypothetical protein